MSFKREQIKRTIEAHFDKELLYYTRGIKVLSLFFIDEVKKYRDYDTTDQKGIYAKIFEQAYEEIINLPKYAPIKDKFKHDVEKIHGGYFSQDKKGQSKDTRGDTNDDISTYDKIMKEKEQLLSFDEPLRFIWSHSALKEGWDNPNVFQVCTLIENKTVFTARQKIGRGLRLCVNQSGERVDDKNLNVLHIIATETFSEFADNLQREIEQETGVKFGVIEIDNFIGLTYEVAGVQKVISHDDATKLVESLREKNYIDRAGKSKDTLKTALESGEPIDLPTFLEPARERIVEQLKQANRKIVVRDAKKQVFVKRKDEMFADPRFMELWNKIKQKTVYRINMDIAKLLENCVKDVANMSPIKAPQIEKSNAKVDIKKSGVTAEQTSQRYTEYKQEMALPDVLRFLSENTKLPRKDIATIIIESNRLQDFANNPQKFIEEVTDIINQNKNLLSIDGLKYTKVEGAEYSWLDVFDVEDTKTIIGYIDQNAVALQNDNSLYDHIIYDSNTVEKPFAIALDNDPDVEFFFKIPERFKISTPIGNYTPDWAVYVKNETEQKFYFVIETKGGKDLRTSEGIKIACGEKHFESLDANILWSAPALNWASVKKQSMF